MKKLVGLLCLLYSVVVFSQPAKISKLNLDHFSTRDKNQSAEFRQLMPESFMNHPDLGLTPYDAPPCSDCIELVDKRDVSSRFFVEEGTGGSHFYQQKSSGEINYLDDNGYWREINHRLQKKGQHLFAATQQPQPITIDLEAGEITLVNGQYNLISFLPELFWRDNNGVDQSLDTPDFDNYTAGDDGIRVTNVYPGIDFIISVRKGKFETSFIVNQPLNFSDGELILRQEIDVPSGFNFSFENGMMQGHREIYLKGSDSTKYFTIEKAFAFSNDVSSLAYFMSSSVINSSILEFSVPMSWMNDPSTQYPVIIDPTVSTQNTLPLVGITGTKFSPVCWTNSCDYFLVVNSPANAVLTSVYHSFEYSTVGMCLAQDGGYSIDYNGCHTPAGAPGVYTDPRPLPNAVVTVTNALIPEFTPCLPAPQCASQSLHFTMHFYRCNNDPDLNCAGNCIRATEPWTIIVEGQTVGISFLTADQQLCENSNAELVVTPSYGLPPYTYSWMPGGFNTDTINVSPAATTQYTITVTDACGQTATDSTTITVAANNNPGFVITPNPVCEDGQVTITGNGNGAVTNYDWIVAGSDAPGGVVNDNQSPVLNYFIPGTFDVILSYANGTCTSKDTMQLTVNPLAITNINITASPSVSICPGDTVTFNSLITNGGVAPTIDWLIDGLIVQSGTADSLVTFALVNGSQVQAILHSTAGCSAPMIDTATLFIAVNSALTPAVSISPDTAVCPGSIITLTANPSNGGTTPSYQWFSNGIAIAGANSATYNHTVSPLDSILTVEMTSSLNCFTTPMATDTAMIDILQNVNAAVTITTDPQGLVCSGDSVEFTAHPEYGGIPQFEWFVNGVQTSVTDSIFTIVPANNDSISVRMTSSLTCVTNAVANEFILAAVSPAVSPSVTLNAFPSSFVCQGDTITFVATDKDAGSNPTFAWYVNGNPAGTNDSTFSSSTLATNDIVQVILTSSLSCAPVNSDTGSVSVTVSGNDQPEVTIIATGSQLCEGDPIQFVASPSNGGATPAYQWLLNGTSMGLTNDTIILLTLLNGDSLSVTMTSSLNCVSSSAVTSQPYVASLQQRVTPEIDIAITPADTICVGQQIIIQANIRHGGSSPAIRWYVNSIPYPATSTIFTSDNFIQGDVIVANLTSNANCLTKAIDTSNFVRIIYHPPIDLAVTSSPPDCPGIPATIVAQPSGGNGGPYHIIWSNGVVDEDTVTIIPDNNTKIFVQVEDNCTVQPATFNYSVPVLLGPEADFGYVNPSPGSFQNNIQFINFSINADSWTWYFPESNTTSTDLNPLHQFPEEGTYDVLLVTWNNNGCIDSVMYNVAVKEEIAVFFPNTFTPNGDGVNDFFKPMGASLEDYEMTIWNRWGEMIFKGSNKTPWDGRVQGTSTYAPEGVYVFRIDLIDAKFENKIVEGKVTLIR